MTSSYRQTSMMAMLDAKPAEKGDGEYWNDDGDHLSPIRKHLISTYLHVSDEEAMPLLGEYFGVALSFVALGALVRASNANKRKQKKTTEAEHLDLRSCSRFQRMALESMLKESMERLRNLSQNAYQLEDRVRNLVHENVAQDKERVQLLKRLADSEKSVQELRSLRTAEGRANERVMCIVAAKEQDWLKEKRGLQKEVEKLKETVTGMTREAKFQARRCRNPTCEHCKGIDRVVRNAKGRMSLRELHNIRDSQAPPNREVLKMDRQVVVPKVDRQVFVPMVERHQEDEEDTVLLIKAMEHKKQSEQQEDLKSQAKVDRYTEWSDSLNTWRAQSGGSASSSGQSTTKDMLVKQQQDMESELANILKRVGMLKQRSYSSTGQSSTQEGSPVEEMELSDDEKDLSELTRSEFVPNLQLRKEEAEKESITPEPSLDDPTLEADYASDQEDYFSVEVEEQGDLVDLDKAFEMRDDHEISISSVENSLVLEDRAGDDKVHPEVEKPVEDISRWDDGIPTATGEQQQLLDEDAEFAAFERSLNAGECVSFAGLRSEGDLLEIKSLKSMEEEKSAASGQHEHHEVAESDESLEVLEVETEGSGKGNVTGVHSAAGEATELPGAPETTSSTHDCQDHNVEERKLTPEPKLDMRSTDNTGDVEGVQLYESPGGRRQEDIFEEVDEEVPESPACSSAGSGVDPIHRAAEGIDEHEQVLEVVEHEERAEPTEALSQPLDPVTSVVAARVDPPAGEVSEQPDQSHTAFDSRLDVQEKRDFKDPASSTERRLTENQDIPLFERNNIDDLGGELPEPEEKRVCGSEILDSVAADSTDEVSGTPEKTSSSDEGKSIKDQDRITVRVESEQKEELFVAEAGLLTDEKSDVVKLKEHVPGSEPADLGSVPAN